MNELNLEDIFNEELVNDIKYNCPMPSKIHQGDKLIRDIESEFTGENTVYLERKKEETSYRNELAQIKNKLSHSYY